MTEPQTPPPKNSSIAVTIVGWIVLVGAILVMGQQIRRDMATHTASSVDDASLKNVEQQLGEIKTALAATPQQGDLMAALRDEDVKLAALSQRFDSLSEAMKKPTVSGGNSSIARLLLTLQSKLLRGESYRDEMEQLSAIPAVSHEGALADLRQNAGGVPTELSLRAGFDAALNSASARNAGQPDPSLQKINSHLNGLITIKPRMSSDAPDAYGKLRNLPEDATLPTLVAAVEELPEADRGPFESWLEQAQARDKALAAFSTLESRLLPLAG